MSAILEQIFADKIESLGRLKVSNDPTYKAELADFLQLVIKTSKGSEELVTITKRLSDVSESLAHPNASSEEKALKIYLRVADGAMKTMLVRSASGMYRAESNGKPFEAYRMMFIQVEILFAYLILKNDLKTWADNENVSKNLHNKNVEATGTGKKQNTYTVNERNGIGVASKPYVLNDYFGRIRGGEIIASSTITVVRNMRDYASHGYHENYRQTIKSYINDATFNLELYIDKWANFMKILTEYL